MVSYGVLIISSLVGGHIDNSLVGTNFSVIITNLCAFFSWGKSRSLVFVMASSYSSLKLYSWSTAIAFIILLLNFFQATKGCFNSIISFGDSLADTGNKLHLSQYKTHLPHFAVRPYGETFFHHPTGRFSDGRLVIDFIGTYNISNLYTKISHKYIFF